MKKSLFIIPLLWFSFSCKGDRKNLSDLEENVSTQEALGAAIVKKKYIKLTFRNLPANELKDGFDIAIKYDGSCDVKFKHINNELGKDITEASDLSPLCGNWSPAKGFSTNDSIVIFNNIIPLDVYEVLCQVEIEDVWGDKIELSKFSLQAKTAKNVYETKERKN